MSNYDYWEHRDGLESMAEVILEITGKYYQGLDKYNFSAAQAFELTSQLHTELLHLNYVNNVFELGDDDNG